MAAYNWIDFEDRCPSCGEVATIRCQTHIPSAYDGDETGRFFDRVYRLGEPMVWWPPGHRKYPPWREDSEPGLPEDQAVEACYASCTGCQAGRYAVVRFGEIMPLEVLDLGPESEMPTRGSRSGVSA